VCLLCYKINGYTKFIYPLKLHEYLASGRPVVGSPIRSLLEFSDVIALARTVEEWSEAMTISLASQASAPTQIEARQRVARQYDWETLVRRIVRTLCDRLGPSYREQIENVFSGTLDTVEP
jgi:glycosyltransferase involved in cell wall biosynthesis